MLKSTMKIASTLCLMTTLALTGFTSVSEAAYMQLGGTFNRLCPDHIGGDREYGGNGPEVDVLLTLRRDSGNSRVVLDVSMNQTETRSNWSEAEFNRSFSLGSAPNGHYFSYIFAFGPNGWGWEYLGNLPVYDTYELFYVDTDHSLDRFFPKEWWLKEVEVNGDTNGKDIGNCTDDDAYINVRLNPIYVWYW